MPARGIVWVAAQQKWRASLRYKGVQVHAGCHERQEDAVKWLHKFAYKISEDPSFVWDAPFGLSEEEKADLDKISLEDLQAQLRRHVFRKQKVNASSKYFGVVKSGNHWLAKVYRFGKQMNLGRFESEVEAAEAYDRGALARDGRLATLNFGREKYARELEDLQRRDLIDQPVPRRRLVPVSQCLNLWKRRRRTLPGAQKPASLAANDHTDTKNKRIAAAPELEEAGGDPEIGGAEDGGSPCSSLRSWPEADRAVSRNKEWPLTPQGALPDFVPLEPPSARQSNLNATAPMRLSEGVRKASRDPRIRPLVRRCADSVAQLAAARKRARGPTADAAARQVDGVQAELPRQKAVAVVGKFGSAKKPRQGGLGGLHSFSAEATVLQSPSVQLSAEEEEWAACIAAAEIPSAPPRQCGRYQAFTAANGISGVLL